MRHSIILIIPTFCFLLAALPPARSADGNAGGDEYRAVLCARAERPADPATAGGSHRRASSPGVLLFSMNGPDNAVCVRSVPDVNGDSLDEIVVGFDESGVDNIFCLDGASVGSATVVWKVQTSDGVSGGSPYGDQCLEPISDSENSGHGNILAGTAWGGRTAYNLDTLAGGTVWKYDTYLSPATGWVYSLCELNDVNGDNVPDCAFGTGSSSDSVYMIDGASPGGQAPVLWQYKAGDAVYSVRDLGDVNGDNKHDVLAAAGDSADKMVCLDGGSTNPSGTVLWTYTPGVSVYACGVMPDISGDGISEAVAVLWTSDGSAIRCVNGATGVEIWASNGVSEYGMMVDVIGDVTGDGTDDLVVSSWENAAIVLSGIDGSLVWKTTVGTVNGGDIWTARAIDDLNGDGRQDVIAGSFDYHVYAMDGDSGEVFWAYSTNNRIYSVYPVGDLNGDGTPEVAAGTQDTNNNTLVYVLEGDAQIPYPGLTLTGTGAIGSVLAIEVTGPAGWTVRIALGRSTASITVPPFVGTLGIQPPLTFLPGGPVPPVGAYVLNQSIPNNPGLIGKTFYIQGLVSRTAPLLGGFSDVESIVIN